MTVLSNLQREKLLYQYHTALEHADMDSVARILAIAEGDKHLENMILELNLVLESELSPEQTDKYKELDMPIFTKEKRKRGRKRPSLTALVAAVSTILLGLLMIGISNHQAYQSAYIVDTDYPSSLIYKYFDANQ